MNFKNICDKIVKSYIIYKKQFNYMQKFRISNLYHVCQIHISKFKNVN